MIVSLERDGETREAASARGGSRNADWKSVVDSHLVDDWPPPEWLAVAVEVGSAGSPSA